MGKYGEKSHSKVRFLSISFLFLLFYFSPLPVKLKYFETLFPVAAYRGRNVPLMPHTLCLMGFSP